MLRSACAQRRARRAAGFGWDALFLPDGHEQPFGAMPMATKNAISHRGRALRRFVQYFREHEADVFAAIERHTPSRNGTVHDGDGLVWGTEKRKGRRMIM